MTDYFREPTEQEAEKMFAKIMDGEIERQSYATFTASNGPMPGNDEPLTLAKLEEAMKSVTGFVDKEPFDTHIFCGERGRRVLKCLFPPSKEGHRENSLLPCRINGYMGLEVWHDDTVPADEIQMGYLRWDAEIVNGKPERKPGKVVTKTFKIA